MQEQLIGHIRRYVALTDEKAGQITALLQERACAKKEMLLLEGKNCRELYFVNKGCLRMYVVKDNGSEQIIQFAIDNWWLSDFTTLGTTTASIFNIQAVEKTELLTLSALDYEYLLQSIPQLERYFRIIMQRAYAASLMRFHYIFDLSAEERYKHFSSSFPDFIQKVPQYMLASYLGFTPEFLSKVRAKRP